MDKRLLIIMATAALVLLTVLSGCTSQQPATPAPTTTIQTPPPVTTVSVTTAATAAPSVSFTTQETKAVKILLRTKGNITPQSFKTFDFSSLGEEFSKVGVDYKIDLKADKPLLGYAVTTTQAAQLRSNELTPTILAGSSDKINWGLITPNMVLDKVTDGSQTFTITAETPYVYVIDGRYLATGNATKDNVPINYDLTITKIYYPVPTPQPNLKY
ncbi:MAG: hypothetical protein WC586_10225 [Methanoregula sp.]